MVVVVVVAVTVAMAAASDQRLRTFSLSVRWYAVEREVIAFPTKFQVIQRDWDLEPVSKRERRILKLELQPELLNLPGKWPWGR